MDIRFVQRSADIEDSLRDYMEKKISRMEKFFKKILNCQIVVSQHKGNFNVETTANANGVILRAEENAHDPRTAFDQALKNLERRIKKYNSYLKDHAQLSVADFTFSVEEPEEISELPEISKVKKIQIHPMSPEEAIMQMELIGHSFFMFQNADTGDMNVVYTRKNGAYGLLEPER